MKKLSFFGILAILCLAGCSSTNEINGIEEEQDYMLGTNEEIVFEGKTYTNIFSDDFDGTELDNTKWEKCPEWKRQEHMSFYGSWSDSCTSVKDGNLVLECKKGPNGWISGAVRTISKDYTRTMFKNTYGLYEIKFKAEYGSGFWYAFWMMANNDEKHISGSASNGAEIDCFELLPNGEGGNHMMTTIHWDAYGKDHKMKGTSGIKVTDDDKDFYDKWHTFQFLWEEDCYKCYLDGKYLWTLDESYGNGICKAEAYMKITAEFGSWGGEVSPEIQNGGSKKMLVDYVKVYKAK